MNFAIFWGLNYFNIIRKYQSFDINKVEVTAWSLLYYTFLIELKLKMDPLFDENNTEMYNIINNEKLYLKRLVENKNAKYPIAYLLIYRRFLLDKV